MSLDAPIPPYNASDPQGTFVNALCMDLLLIEMVPMAFRTSSDIITANGKGKQALDEDELRDGASQKLDSLGYRVGQGLVERFSRDRPRFTDTLDMIKFLCKDIWTLVFRKQIDNLKTNHRGVYVLTDNGFKPFTRMSMASSSEAVTKAHAHLWFPCGIIRGSLASMGTTASVLAETSELPSAAFQIKIANKKT